MKLNAYAISVIAAQFFLVGCNSYRSVENVDPSSYQTVAAYSEKIFDSANCAYSLFVKQGQEYVDSDGLNYRLPRNEVCYLDSIEKAIKQYCQSKGGYMRQDDEWCAVGDYPLFKVNFIKTYKRYFADTNYSTLERSTAQTPEQWVYSAEKKGFISERIRIKNQIEAQNRIQQKKLEEEEKNRKRNAVVKAKVGDLLCREDYEAPAYQYSSTPYYKAYVEDKQNGKYKLRLVWHGGKGFVINDIRDNTIIWSSPNGWLFCR